MTMTTQPACYGGMFPDILATPIQTKLVGKVFSIELQRAGLAYQDKSLIADREQWQHCLQCDAFDHCYKFAMAKLALETSLSSK